MFGRSASLALALAFAGASFAPGIAHAKKWTFDSGTPFGFGLVAGLAQNPDTSLVGGLGASAPSASSSFSHFVGFEPFLDFGNYAVRVSGQLVSYPVFTATGSDGGGAYSETSDVGALSLGASLILAPYVSENKTARGYMRLGVALARSRGENVRNYSSVAYTEKFEGDFRELSLGAGLEFFLAQNYSLQIEAGFRQMEVDRFTYRSGTDRQGNAKNAGDSLLNTDGTNRKMNHSGAYGSLGLNLHF